MDAVEGVCGHLAGAQSVVFAPDVHVAIVQRSGRVARQDSRSAVILSVDKPLHQIYSREVTKKTNITVVIDERDRQILHLVQRDASLAQAEIARQVGLSTAAVHERLKKLVASGVIRRWTAVVDGAAVGASITAFVEIFLDHPRYEPALLERVVRLDDVLECHHVTGEFSLLLKVRVRNMEALRQLLLHQLGALDGVSRTRTVVVLSTVKEETYVAPVVEGAN
jgi:Lrp/AsnC family leucine-responsive transcriptional regulator